MSAMRLSAGDCLRRGWTNLAANWELVLLQWLQSLVVLVLMALGLLLPVVTLGADALGAGRSAAKVLAVATARLGHPGRLSPPVILAGVAMLAVWLLSVLVHSWFQAGTYGVLTSAERQALPGRRRPRLLFRTFSLRDFSGWGGLYLGRFFRLLVVFWALALPLAVAVLVWLISLAVGGRSGASRPCWGSPSAASSRWASSSWSPGCGATSLRRIWRGKAQERAPPRGEVSRCWAGAWARSPSLSF